MVHQDMIIVDMKITMCIFNQFELDPNSASSSAHIQNQIIVVKTRLFFTVFPTLSLVQDHATCSQFLQHHRTANFYSETKRRRRRARA